MPVIITEEYMDPEIFCEVQGHSIYRVYKNGDAASPMSFQFSTSKDEDNLRCQFDVREVAAEMVSQEPEYPLPVSQPHRVDPEWTEEAKQQVICDAFVRNLLPLPNDVDDWWQTYRESGAVNAIAEDDLPDHDLPDG